MIMKETKRVSEPLPVTPTISDVLDTMITTAVSGVGTTGTEGQGIPEMSDKNGESLQDYLARNKLTSSLQKCQRELHMD